MSIKYRDNLNSLRSVTIIQRRKGIDDELILLIANMFLPFSLASNPFFKLMMNEAGIGDICILRQLFEGSN